MNDKKLIKKCLAGDKEAFNKLISIYYPFVTKFLLKLTRDEDVTKDLTQETFLKLIYHIDKFCFKKEGTFSTYLITIAKNTYIDYIRKKKVELQEVDIQTLSNYISTEEEFFKEENLKVLLTKIDHLPKAQREAIKLKYIEGYTLNEIARFKNTKSKTIKSRLFEGKKKLREEIKGESFYE